MSFMKYFYGMPHHVEKVVFGVIKLQFNYWVHLQIPVFLVVLQTWSIYQTQRSNLIVRTHIDIKAHIYLLSESEA